MSACKHCGAEKNGMAWGEETYACGMTSGYPVDVRTTECLRRDNTQISADRDRLAAELATVRGAMAADDERMYRAWERIHGAPEDCANIGCDAPEWMAEEILRLRAELARVRSASESLATLIRLRYPRLVERGNPLYDATLDDALAQTDERKDTA